MAQIVQYVGMDTIYMLLNGQMCIIKYNVFITIRCFVA
jgi:hypothetical protein